MKTGRPSNASVVCGEARSRHTPDLLSDPDVMDQVIFWRMNDPRYTTRETRVKGKPMQRQWTIEARADFSDQEKNDAITQAFKVAAAHINATMQLLSDGQKPEVVCFSDDFFAGHEEINWLGDPLGKAIASVQIEEAPVSSELLQAARDIAHDKNTGSAGDQ